MNYLFIMNYYIFLPLSSLVASVTAVKYIKATFIMEV